MYNVYQRYNYLCFIIIIIIIIIIMKLDGLGTKLFMKCFTNELLIQFIKIGWLVFNTLSKVSLNEHVLYAYKTCHRLSFEGRPKKGFKMIQRNLEKTNFYITKSSVQQTIFYTLVIVKCMEKNLDITKPCIANTCYQSLGPDFFISRFHCTRKRSLFFHRSGDCQNVDPPKIS